MPVNDGNVEAVFIATIRIAGGEKGIYLNAEEADQYQRDADAFAASSVGLSLTDYMEWVQTDGTPLCSTYTKRGKLCQNVLAPMQYLPSRWKLLHRKTQCTSHAARNNSD